MNECPGRVRGPVVYEIFKEFTFGAAHRLTINSGRPSVRAAARALFQGRGYLRGEPDKNKNRLYDFGELV